MKISLFRRRSKASKRGFSHVSTTLEAAAILGWFAVAVTSERRLDQAITARRAAESSAQDSAHASASPCNQKPVENAVSDSKPHANIKIDNDKLGVPESSFPRTEKVGVQQNQAFPQQHAPMKSASATSKTTSDQAYEDRTASFQAKRGIACQEESPKNTKPDPAQLRSQIWDKNLRGY